MFDKHEVAKQPNLGKKKCDLLHVGFSVTDWALQLLQLKVPSIIMMPAQTVPFLLLHEALGFLPQLLLDDIINVANNTVTDGVNGLEEFLQ